MSMHGLNKDERAKVGLVHDFVNREVKPTVGELEHDKGWHRRPRGRA
jgi:hypothetical protein